jgi:hypothetical protein
MHAPDSVKFDNGSRGPCLVEYHWVAGPWRRWLALGLVVLAIVAGIEVTRAFGLLSEQLRPLEGVHAIVKPVVKTVSFLLAVVLYYARTSFHLNALQVSWRTTPIPFFADGAVSRSEIVELKVEKFPGVPEFMAGRSYTLAAVLRSGEKRHMLQLAAREPALEVGQLLAAEMQKPGPADPAQG